MVKYFHGPDTYAAREAIAAVAHQESARVRWVDREQLEEKGIRTLIGESHGFFGKDVVVVRDPSSLPKALQEDIAEAIVRAEGGTTWIAWDRVAPDKRSKLWRALKPNAREFSTPAAASLAKWLQARAGELGGAVALPAAEMLVARLGSNRWRLENELQRLLVVANGTEVSMSLLDYEVVGQEHAEIFAILDTLVRGERARAVAGVQNLLAAGHSEFYVLSMLGYQFRTLVVIRAGLDQGLSAAALAREGRVHPYVVEKNIPVARHLSYAGWRDSLTRILATDFAIKQGKVDARTGLLMLILTLSQSLQGVQF